MYPDHRPLTGRVLVRMPTTRDSERTAELLREVGIATTICANLAELCRALRGDADGVIMTDDLMATDTSGQLAEAVRAQPGWSSMPFIVVTREGAAQKVQQTSTEVLRNVVVIERPVRPRSLVSVALSALRGRVHQYEIRDAIILHQQQATESRRLHEALQSSQDELARQAAQLRSNDRRKDDFLATLAHELRNPLAPIRTGMELLYSSTQRAADRPTLAIMRRQLSHLVRLIDDLLDISRINQGKLELRREPVTLAAIIASATEATRPLVDAAGHALCIVVDDPDLVIHADPTRASQVVANLLHNACKYTAPGGHIELYAGSAGEQVLIRVTDDGIGIPPDRIDRIFEMFNQVDSAIARSQGGLGIGLALVRRLVEMHHGTVTAESAGADAGSTFTVRLPIGAAAERRLSASPPPPARAAAGESVLVVDDNVDAADLLCQMLEQAGYSAVAAYDSESALAEVARRDHAIVILDIGLPGKNGYEVAREVRSMANREDVALIALTGWGSAEDKRKARSAGFDVHLTKPIDPAVLQEVVADMARRRTERALDRHR